MVKMLTVLVSTISNTHVFLLKKCEMQKLLISFQQKYSVFAIFIIIKSLIIRYIINNVASFEELGADVLIFIIIIIKKKTKKKLESFNDFIYRGVPVGLLSNFP